MELFKIGSGPWEKLFEGSFQKYSVQLLSNPESTVLVAIFDSEGEKVNGVITEFYKVYSAAGSIETFSETLPRELLVLTKHDSSKTSKFLAIGSGASYTEWNEEKVMLETESQLSKLKTSSEMIKDVSKAYDLQLTELKKSSSDVKEEFFTHPMLLPTMFTSYHAPPGIAQAQGIQEQSRVQVSGEIILGLTREGQLVEEPLSLFARTVIFDGKEISRKQAMQLLIEGSLLSNVPAVIFDSGKDFEGVGFPTKDSAKLKEFKLEIEPIGFPARKFAALAEIQANLSAISPESLLEVFGVSAEIPMGKVITNAMRSRQCLDMKEIAEAIKKAEITAELTVYHQLKAIRALNLIILRYPRLFDGKNDIEEISKNWVRAIGRASLIDLSGLGDKRQALLLITGLVKEMLSAYKEKGLSKQVKSMIFIPEISAFSQFYKTVLFKELESALLELKEYGAGFCTSLQNEIDLDEELAKSIEAEIGLVIQNDAGVKFAHRKQYRVLLRPTISEFKATEK